MQRASDVAKATAAYPAVLATFEDELQELRAYRTAAEARLRHVLSAMTSFRDGDFSVRLPVDWAGTEGRIAKAFLRAVPRAPGNSGLPRFPAPRVVARRSGSRLASQRSRSWA